MPYCVLRYCKNSSRNASKSEGVTFHRFPRVSHDKRENWIKYVQKERREDTWLPTEHSSICSVHFKDSDIYLTKSRRRYLKKNAVPYIMQNEMSSRPITPISVVVSDSESIFDTPRKIKLKRKMKKIITNKNILSQKVKKLQRQNKQLKKKNISLLALLKSAKQKYGLDMIAETNLSMNVELVEIYKNIILKSKTPKSSLRYVPVLRKFALTLNYYSPAAYKYVRERYNKVLPHPRTLSRWYGSVNGEPGFTSESFKILKLKANSTDKPLLCSLVFDEMSIRQQKLFSGQRKLGAVDFGTGPIEGEDTEKVASQALVFMIVSLNESWKIPVGYFLIAGINAAMKSNLIKTCLQKCHDAGVTIVNLTFDGCAANFSAVETLGCKLTDISNMQTHFPHPSTGDKVCVFVDPCHVVKMIRNAWENKRLFFDGQGAQIKWQLLINLVKLQQSEGLKFANKLTVRHIHFRNQVMKVRLAVQLLSLSVANALIACDEVLHSSSFCNTGGTVNFITLMNNFFDIMNSQKRHFYGYKRPVDLKTKSEIYTFLDKFKEYILSLQIYVKKRRVIKRKNREPRIICTILKKRVIETASKTGFLGAIICLESLKILFNSVVEEKQLLSYLSVYRFSQDHIELLFGLIRKHGGYNNNPNVLQFRAAYKKILNHLELKSSFTGNCIPLDNFVILNASSVNVINNTSTVNRHNNEDYQILRNEFVLNSDLEAENNCAILSQRLEREQSTSTIKLIVGYISGYISRILTKQLKCETCVNSLTTKDKLWHHKLVTIKDMGGLCYSTEEVYKICLKTDTLIRILIRESGGSLSEKYTLQYIVTNTIKCFIDSAIFECLNEHSLDQPGTFNHRVHLIRAIIQKYAKIRLYHEAKSDPSVKSTSKRQKLTKLILFEGN